MKWVSASLVMMMMERERGETPARSSLRVQPLCQRAKSRVYEHQGIRVLLNTENL